MSFSFLPPKPYPTALAAEPPKRVVQNIFFAHPKGHPDIARLRVEIEAALGGTEYVRVTSGEDDFALNFTRFGGWVGWSNSIVTGMERNLHGQLIPRYGAIVVAPTLEIGKATAEICRKALSISKPVLYWDGKQFLRAQVVRTLNAGNAKSGWMLG